MTQPSATPAAATTCEAERTVADAMISIATLHGITTPVREIRPMFDDEHVHAALIVDDTVLVAVIEPADLGPCARDNDPAVHVGTLEGRIIRPDVPLDQARQLLIRTRRRRRPLATTTAPTREVHYARPHRQPSRRSTLNRRHSRRPSGVLRALTVPTQEYRRALVPLSHRRHWVPPLSVQFDAAVGPNRWLPATQPIHGYRNRRRSWPEPIPCGGPRAGIGLVHHRRGAGRDVVEQQRMLFSKGAWNGAQAHRGDTVVGESKVSHHLYASLSLLEVGRAGVS